MRKVIVGLILAVVFGAAFAIELPKQARLTLMDGSGAIVGVAEFKEGEFELELLEGFSGLVTVTSVDAEGNVLVFDATVGEDGSVTLIDTQTLEFVDLTAAVAAAGGRLEVSFDDEIEADDEADLDDAEEEEEADEDFDDGEDADEDDLDEESEDEAGEDEQNTGDANSDDQNEGDDDSGSDEADGDESRAGSDDDADDEDDTEDDTEDDDSE